MAKAKGPRGVKGSDNAGQGKPETVKLKLTLNRETARLLRLEAFGRDVSLGQVLEELVRASPRRFVLTDRARVTLGSEVPPPQGQDGPQRAPGASHTLGVVSREECA